MKRILDRSFRYVSSVDTNISKTFARERKRLAELKKEQERIVAEQQKKVVVFGK